MNKIEAAKKIKAQYDDCLLGYESSMAALEKLGYTEVQADNILVPLRRMSGYEYQSYKK